MSTTTAASDTAPTKEPSPWDLLLQELPVRKYRPGRDRTLIDDTQVRKLLATLDETNAASIQDDINTLNQEILPKYHINSRASKENKDRYLRYQVSYAVLAAGSILLASFQALLIGNDQHGLMFITGIIQASLASLLYYLALVSRRDNPLQKWVDNRRRTEGLRQEYFTYLLRLPPYDVDLNTHKRRGLLKSRAFAIHTFGKLPNKPE
jgi:hypothetical protein